MICYDIITFNAHQFVTSSFRKFRIGDRLSITKFPLELIPTENLGISFHTCNQSLLSDMIRWFSNNPGVISQIFFIYLCPRRIGHIFLHDSSIRLRPNQKLTTSCRISPIELWLIHPVGLLSFYFGCCF